MTNPSNVTVITEKLIGYLRHTRDEYIRSDLVSKVTQLAERFAPDNLWFIQTMNDIFELGTQLLQNLEIFTGKKFSPWKFSQSKIFCCIEVFDVVSMVCIHIINIIILCFVSMVFFNLCIVLCGGFQGAYVYTLCLVSMVFFNLCIVSKSLMW